MKKIQLAILLAFAGFMLAGLSSCIFNCVHGSGHLQTESRKVDDFSRIEISGGFKVNIRQDSSMNVKITADDNLLKYIKASVSGNKLRIYSKRNMCGSGEMTVSIGFRKLEELRASGAVDIMADGKVITQDLRIKLSGATKVTMDLQADHVNTSGSGVTELNLKGQATSHDIDLSGSGKVYAFDFVVGNCEIHSSGACHNEVNVLHQLDVHSSGASEVKYKGNPNVNNSKSGASSVEKVN